MNNGINQTIDDLPSISPKAQKLFKIRSVNNLLTKDLFVWRRRRIVQIEDIDEKSYRERVSYQFYFPPDLIVTSLKELYESGLTEKDNQYITKTASDDLMGKVFDIYIPMDYLPKRTLLDFDLRDSTNRAMILLDRFDTTNLTLVALIFPQLGKIEKDFVDPCEKIITSLIFQAPHDLRSIIKNLDIKLCHSSEKLKFKILLTNLLERYFGDHNFIEEHDNNIDNICTKIDELRETLNIKNIISTGDPSINVFMLALDYFKTAKLHSPDIKLPQGSKTLLRSYFDDCNHYLNAFINSKNKHKIHNFLSFYVEQYFAFVPIKVHIGDHIILKSEQLLVQKAKESFRYRFIKRVQRVLNPFMEQLYPIKIGTESSHHYEVKCHEPSEIEIIPEKSFIEVRNKRDIRINNMSDFFGYSSSYTCHTQHFYTTKGSTEIDQILKHRGIAQTGKYYLGITYKIDPTLICMYRIGLISVLISLLILLFAYVPPELQSSEIKAGAPAFLPFIVPIIVLALRFRTKEKLVSDYFNWYKNSILAAILFMIIYAAAQVFWPETFNPNNQIINFLKESFNQVIGFWWDILKKLFLRFLKIF